MITRDKDAGRAAALEMTRKLCVDVSFVGMTRDGRFMFSTTRYRLYMVIGQDRKVEREASIQDQWARDSEYVYCETHCYREQLSNGDLDFLITNRMTQEPHERFLETQ